MRNTKLIAALSVALIASAASAQVNYLVNDVFTDTDRIGGLDGSTPTTAIGVPTTTNTQWVVNDSNAGKLVASETGMLWTPKTSSNSMLIGYFPSVALTANVPMTFTLNFTTGALGATTNNLRIALLDSSPAGFRTTDGFGSTDDAFVGDKGYGIFSASSNVGGPTAPTDLVLRTNQRFTFTNDLLNSSAGWGNNTAGNTYFAASSGATGYLQANTAYALSLTLNYDGSALALTTSLSGGNFSGMNYTIMDDTDPTLSFDSFAIRIGNQEFTTVNLDSFTVTTPIPEPSTYAAIFGALALGLVAYRRRKQV